MATLIKHRFFNQPGRLVGMFFKIALGLFLISVPFLVQLVRQHSREDAAAWAVGAMVLNSLAVAMLLSGLLTWPSARKANRTFAAFEAGDFLVHWEYKDPFWKGVVDAAGGRIAKGARGGFVLMMIFCLFVAMMPIWASPDVHRKIMWTVLAVPISAIPSYLVYWMMKRYQTRKTRRMREFPEAYIAKDAAYCAGDYLFWGTKFRALQGLKILHDGTIEIVVGMSKGVKGAVGAIDLVNLAMLHPSNASQQVTRMKIAVPPGEEKKAAEVVMEILTDLDKARRHEGT
jgi:hypothetical protein